MASLPPPVNGYKGDVEKNPAYLNDYARKDGVQVTTKQVEFYGKFHSGLCLYP